MRSTIRKIKIQHRLYLILRWRGSRPSEDFTDDIDLNLSIDAVRKLDDKLKSVIAYIGLL